MYFQRTFDSLLPLISQVPFHQEQDLAELLRIYEQQLERGTDSPPPDRGLLMQAMQLFQQRLRSSRPVITTELAILGHYLSLETGAYDECSTFLQDYLATPRTPDEEAWARWHRVDMLALARHCPQVIEEQQSLLRFALDHFPVDQCLFVLADGTQARCWENMGQGSAWIVHVEQLLHQIEPSVNNRTDRFYVARTAAYVCLSLQEWEQAHQYAQTICALTDEDATWPENQRLIVEAALIRLKMSQEHADHEGIRRIGQEIITSLAATNSRASIWRREGSALSHIVS